GDLRYAVDDRAVMMYIDELSTATEGDLIITAGTTGLFPYGLPVGNVTEIDLEESGISRTAHLAPSVDFSKLESVTVLLDFEGKGESFGES
ncbi:MAG: rod shape-determining protein MreC, partial [Oscillospiraceae bacterium]|nr:rod shape-determining protein MreC [Oscillospiraceae bacterium]